MCCDDYECRVFGWLLSLPFAFIALIVFVFGIWLWIVGLILSCFCPCFLCVTTLVEIGIEFTEASINVMKWFVGRIPC